jgi:hypothetical protein
MRLVLPAFALLTLVALSASCVPSHNNENGTGGTPGTGGSTKGTGGTAGSGGSKPPSTGKCTDVGDFSVNLTAPYDKAKIKLKDNPNKNYVFQTNWWGKYGSTPPTEAINGLSFTMANPNNDTSTDNMPMGYPSYFIGSYSGTASSGSNLPKAVSSLTAIPTVMSVNSDVKGITNYNAAYDVWFTQSSALVTGSSPGSGGAYLMVWLFKPTDRQPRGKIEINATFIGNLPGSWDVWVDRTNPPCISYVATKNTPTLEFDLNEFIQDAVKNNYGVTNSQYLSIIFGGFEVWGGNDGIQMNKFCANVE